MSIKDQVSQGIFNPVPPDTQDPKFTYAKPIEKFQFLSGEAAALHAGGDILSGAIKGSDEIIKAFATDDTRRAMEAVRSEYTSELETIDNAVRTKVAALPSAGASDVMGAATGNQPLPPELQNFPKRLAALSGARASGKLSETDYAGRADTLLSDIRSRYPVEYRPIIDHVASDVLGFDPANKRITSMLGDINSFLAAKQEGVKEVHAQFRHLANTGDPGAAAAMERFDKTGDVYEAQRWISSRNYDKWYLEHQKTQLETYENDQKGKGIAAEKFALANLSIAANSWIDDLFEEMKTKGVKRGPNGNFELDSNGQEQLGQGLANMENRYRSFARQFLDTADLGGESYTKLRGAKSREELVDQLVKPITDLKTRVVGTADTSMAQSTARASTAVINDAKFSILKNPNMGPVTAVAAAMKDMLPPEAFNTYFASAGMAQKINQEDLAKYVTKLDYSSQTWNNPYPLKEVLDKNIKAGFTTPKTINDLIDTFYGSKGLLNDKAPEQFRLTQAIGLAHPTNKGWLSSIDPEYTDASGAKHEGQMDVWHKVTSPAVAQSIHDLSMKSLQWQVFDGYRDNMTAELRAGMFAPALRRLAEVTKWAPLEWHADEKSGQFYWEFRKEKKDLDQQAAEAIGTRRLRQAGYRGSLDPTTAEAESIIGRVNDAIKGVVNISKVAGINPNEALLSLFNDMGFDLSSDKIRGIPDAMVQSIKNANKERAEQRERFKNLGTP